MEKKVSRVLHAMCGWELDILLDKIPHTVAPFLPLPVKLFTLARCVMSTEGLVAYDMPSRRLREWCIRYTLECIKNQNLSVRSLRYHIRWMVEEENLSLFRDDLREVLMCCFSRFPRSVMKAFDQYIEYKRPYDATALRRVLEAYQQTYWHRVNKIKDKLDELHALIKAKVTEAIHDPCVDYLLQWGFTVGESIQSDKDVNDSMYLPLYQTPLLHMMYIYGFPPDPLMASHGWLSDQWDVKNGEVVWIAIHVHKRHKTQ